MSFVPAISGTLRVGVRQQPSSQPQSSVKQNAFLSSKYEEEEDASYASYEKDCPCGECESARQVNMSSSREQQPQNSVRVKQELEESSTKVISMGQLNSMNTTSSLPLKGKFFSKFPPVFRQPTQNAINPSTFDVSLHDHKTCPCFACFYKLSTETLLEAKESEIISLKEIIYNKEQLQIELNRSKDEEISNSNEVISRLSVIKDTLEKAVKDKSEKIKLLEGSSRDRIIQLDGKINKLKDENQIMKKTFEIERDNWKQSLLKKDEALEQIEKLNRYCVNELEAELKRVTNENSNLVQSFVEKLDKEKQMNDKNEELQLMELSFQGTIKELKDKVEHLTDENGNLITSLADEYDKLKQSNDNFEELKQINLTNQRRMSQLKETLDDYRQMLMAKNGSDDVNQSVKEKERLKQMHVESVNQLKTDSKNSVDEKKINKLKSDYCECAELKELFYRALQNKVELIEKHQQELDQLKTNIAIQYERDVNRVKEEMKTNFENQIASQKVSLDAAHIGAIEYFKQELANKYQQEMEKAKEVMIAKHQREIESLKDVNATEQLKLEVDRLKKEMVNLHQGEMDQLKTDMTSEHQQEMDKVKDAIEFFKQEFANKYQQELEKAKEVMTAEHRLEMTKREKEKIDENQRQIDQLRDELKSEHQNELNELKGSITGEYQRQLDHLKMLLTIEQRDKEVMINVHQVEMDQLQTDLSIVHLQEMDQLKEEIANERELIRNSFLRSSDTSDSDTDQVTESDPQSN